MANLPLSTHERVSQPTHVSRATRDAPEPQPNGDGSPFDRGLRDSPAPGGPRLIGRRSEIGVLDRFIDGVHRGLVGLLLVEGEAGAGKSALLQHVVATSNPDRLQLLWGEGDPNDLRSFRCLADAMGCRPTSADPTRVRIAQLLRSAGPTSGIGSAPAIQELLIDVIERVASTGPTLLLVDDLQWVDDASVTFVGSLTRRLRGIPFGVIAATRPSRRVSRLLDGYSPQRCPLGELADEELAGIAEQVMGVAPSEEMLATLRSVRGNPFLAMLVAAGQPSSVGSPQFGSELLRAMTQRLEPEHRALLELAAIAGREIDVDALAQATGAPLADVVSQVRACQRIGWLESDRESVRFRHDLLVEALVSALPVDARDRKHLQLGRAIGRVGHAPGRVAFHLDAAAYLLTIDDLALIRPALNALPADDPIALTLANRAHGLDPADAETAAYLIRCLAVRHRHEEALAIGQRWLAGRTSDHQEFGRVRLAMASSLLLTRRASAVIEFLGETLEAPSLTAIQRAEALNAIARLQWHVADAEQAEVAATVALDASRAAGWPVGEMHALCTRSESAALRGFADDAIADALAAQQIADREHLLETAAPALALGTAVAATGRMSEALPILTSSLRAAERAGDVQAMVLAQVTMQATRYHIGEWDAFVADAEAMADIGHETGTRSGVVLPLGFAASVAMRRGRFGEVKTLAARVRAEHTLGDAHPGARLGVALARLAELEALGSLAEACVHACAVAEVLAPAGPSAQSIVVVDAARLAWQVGDLTRLRAVDAIVSAAATVSPTENRRSVAGYVGALASGEPADIAAAARRLAETERVWDAATSLHVAGIVGAKAGNREAAKLLRAAADRYEMLGAHVHATAARSGRGFDWLHETDRTGQPPATMESLSAAERRVLRLVSAGEPNGAIADALFISKRTVESHLAALYRKLGMATRVELAKAGASIDEPNNAAEGRAQ